MGSTAAIVQKKKKELERKKNTIGTTDMRVSRAIGEDKVLRYRNSNGELC